MSRRYRLCRTDAGQALQSRITLAFRDLNRMGYLAIQSVSGASDRWSGGARGRVMRWLTPIPEDHGYSPKVLARAQARRRLGAVWTLASDDDEYGYSDPGIRVYMARASSPVSGEPWYPDSQDEDGILLDLGVVLAAHGVEHQGMHSTHPRHGRGADRDWSRVQHYVWCRLTKDVMEAAAASKTLGGREAFLDVVHPTRRKPKESEER